MTSREAFRGEALKCMRGVKVIDSVNMRYGRTSAVVARITKALQAAHAKGFEAGRDAAAKIPHRHARLMDGCSDDNEEAKIRERAYTLMARKIRSLPTPTPSGGDHA